MGNSSKVIHADDATFETEVLGATTPVLVDFGATWCGPCKVLAKIVDEIAREHTGIFKVVAVDIDEAPRVAERYGIRSAPTVMVFEGGKKTQQRVGLTNKATLLQMLGYDERARATV